MHIAESAQKKVGERERARQGERGSKREERRKYGKIRDES